MVSKWSAKIDPWMHFGRLLAPFWIPCRALGLPFVSPLAPVGSLFDSFSCFWLNCLLLLIPFAAIRLFCGRFDVNNIERLSLN